MVRKWRSLKAPLEGRFERKERPGAGVLKGYYDTQSGRLEDLAALCERELRASDVPLAAQVQSNVPVYDMAARHVDLFGEGRRDLMAEWAWVLGKGPGVLVMTGGCHDLDAIDAASEIFHKIIAQEAATAKADHFAAAGSNSRIWNALEKLCVADAEVFARYHANPAMDAVCEAWLGPAYQMTAQVNLVHPGGAAQTAHRDYHLGFMIPERAAQYPAHIHNLSAALTLQGAIAHCDMPLETGPTKLLPFSQMLEGGYLAYHRPEIAEFFEARCVQLPLAKGDMLFFNPALFHGAGANVTPDVGRLANLVQISSSMGRAMETVDRAAMCRALYPIVQRMAARGGPMIAVDAAIAAAAEGYGFPTSLDRDPPVGGLAPESMAQLVRRALEQGLLAGAFEVELDALMARRGG